jgi:hypothetical protein
MFLRTFALAIASVPLVAGCHAAEINAHSDAEIRATRSSAERSFVYGSCDMQVTVPCSLIMTLVSTEHYRTAFRDKFCANKTDEACEESYRRMVDAALAKRYWAANWNFVTRECALHPNQCDDGVAFERFLLASHNAEIQRRYADDVDQIEARREAELHADTQRSLAAVGDALTVVAAMRGARVCRSYPSVFGGFMTVCSR